MKRIFSIFLIFLLLIFASCMVYGTDYEYEDEPYTFEITYTGDVMVGEAKDLTIKFIGVDGPAYTDTLIKIATDGPSIPQIIAHEDDGAERDIVEIGDLGPSEGSPVEGTFVNNTPVKATFDVAGTYKISLYLVDLTEDNTVITRKDTFIEVSDKIEKLPDTGTSIWEYTGYSALTITILGIGYALVKKGRYES